ncbi:hypothetical protein SAMN04487829_0012 [Pseudobutyrivibrio sp. NOR37]|uniref:Uncharacterized protein n=1 Tax=Pseudobutyrivibrio xylanivorans TaxID=185007 RepID=A0A6M0LCW1_PSEXY|nr:MULTISPECIES: hypothetical protein [Pseudobutyrivibrio]NEX00445.1 hypothetical protein [Pseudobutyrivibrio xylanivorans]SFR59656.1 hypothetical protein SAMN04487829_0012 [Pseudobutyrivibrio sp. NOR37]
MARADEDILYDLYIKLAESAKETKKKGKTKANTTEQLRVILNRIPTLLLYLDEMNLPQAEINRYLEKAKSLFLNYATIKKRRPELVSAFLDKKMDQLVHSIARNESTMVSNFRTQELSGERLDIASLFEGNNYYRQLLDFTAVQVIRKILNENFTSVGKTIVLFITDTGRKYHKQDCPYCKGKHLKPATRAVINNLGLEPCKCIKDEEDRIKLNDSYRTIFIDESIHPVAWNENGIPGKAGSYSYIICRGLLEDESQITPSITISSGVEYVPEMQHTERITKTAIGKVMMIAAFDYNFKGNIKIFTDNSSAMQTWQKENSNMRIAELFESVTVQLIPREQNTAADVICRTHMCLKVPIDKYNDLKNRYNMHDSLVNDKKALTKQLEEKDLSIETLNKQLEHNSETIDRLQKENANLQTKQSLIRKLFKGIKTCFFDKPSQFVLDK